MVKATDSNLDDYLFPSGSAGSNPAGVVFAWINVLRRLEEGCSPEHSRLLCVNDAINSDCGYE